MKKTNSSSSKFSQNAKALALKSLLVGTFLSLGIGLVFGLEAFKSDWERGDTVTPASLNALPAEIKRLGDKTIELENRDTELETGMNNKIAFMVVKTAKQTLAPDQIIAWDRVEVNKGDGFDLGANTFIAPEDGLYYFHADILGYNNTNTGYYKICKNGTDTGYSSYAGNRAVNEHQQSVMSAVMDLKVNDTIDIRAESDQTPYANPRYFQTKFSGFKL
jgi:hypothetical protein